MLIGIRPKLVQNRTRRFLLERLGASRAQVHDVQVGANDGRLDDPVRQALVAQGYVPSRIGDDLVAFDPSYPMIAPTELLDLIGFD